MVFEYTFDPGLSIPTIVKVRLDSRLFNYQVNIHENKRNTFTGLVLSITWPLKSSPNFLLIPLLGKSHFRYLGNLIAHSRHYQLVLSLGRPEVVQVGVF